MPRGDKTQIAPLSAHKSRGKTLASTPALWPFRPRLEHPGKGHSLPHGQVLTSPWSTGRILTKHLSQGKPACNLQTPPPQSLPKADIINPSQSTFSLQPVVATPSFLIHHFHFSLSCIGEGNGSPLQCSCLENPRDGGAWCAAVYGVTQSRTRLK